MAASAWVTPTSRQDDDKSVGTGDKTAQSPFPSGVWPGQMASMADVIFLAVIIGFFALTVLFVRGCDRVIGPDTGPPDGDQASPDTGTDSAVGVR